MAAKLLDLVANVFFHDVKRKESAGRGHCLGAGPRDNQSAQLLFATAQESAIGVVMIMISSVPSRWCEMTKDRMTSSVTMPPAFLKI